MDPSTAALIDGLRAATNVADLSGKIDHSSRHLVATGGYSTVYTAGWKSPSSKIPLKVIPRGRFVEMTANSSVWDSGLLQGTPSACDQHAGNEDKNQKDSKGRFNQYPDICPHNESL